MGEIVPMFLKVNIKSHGYIYTWSDKINATIDEQILDKVLPDFDTATVGPYVAYTGTRLATNQFILVVGGYWKEGKDEYGRSGLRFWCGALVNETRRSHDALWRLSDIFLGILQRFEIGYERIGDILADLAVKKQDPNWAVAVFGLMQETQSPVDDFGRRLVLSFLENKKHLSSRVNFQVRFPIHPNIAVPCMLSMLLFENGVGSIGGGSLLVAQSRDMQIISKKENPKNYVAIVINDLIPTKWGTNNRPKKITDNENRVGIILRRLALIAFIILITLALHVALYFTLRQLVR
jgi:hypothetical protein